MSRAGFTVAGQRRSVAADSTPVNSQITDAVTQTNVKVVAEAPAQAMAALYQVASHSAGLSLQNAIHSQQALNQISSIFFRLF